MKDAPVPPPDTAPVELIVLEPALLDADPQRFQRLFAQFEAGYRNTFHGDEAEPTTEWIARIRGKASPQPVMRITVAVERDVAGGERVVGGLATELYRASGCVLATYIYVLDEPHLRHKGHARRLLARARTAYEGIGPVHAMIAEAEWPDDMAADVASEEGDLAPVEVARERLRFFARIHARLLNIDYVQPALGPGQQPVSLLRMLVIPRDGDTERPDDDELGACVAAFLEEFYAALGEESGLAPDATTLARLKGQCIGDSARRPFTSLLPRLRQHDTALCLHFIEALETSGPGGAAHAQMLEVLRSYTCPVLHSMETDLLSRAYRDRRPLRTVCVTKPTPQQPEAGVLVEIEFPESVTFASEARTEVRHWPLRRRRVRAYLSFTAFFEARVLAWHLTLRADRELASSDPRYWLDEQDLIVLQKLADDVANQERLFSPAPDNAERHITQAVRFTLPDDPLAPAGDTAPADADKPTQPMDIDALLRKVGRIAQQRCLAAAQRMFPDPERIAREVPPVPDPYKAIAATLQLLSRSPVLADWDWFEREALCGIVSCILDFDEIDEAEVDDTMAASIPLDDALLRVHRVAMVYVAEDDRAARTVEQTVGVSPYLLVPHAAVLCDEWLLARTESLHDEKCKPGDTHGPSRQLALLESTLRKRWIPNVFFYKTEKQLFDCALRDSGVLARRANAEELLQKVKSDLQLARDYQRAKFEAIVAGLLGAISVLSLESLVSKGVIAVLGALNGPAGGGHPAAEAWQGVAMAWTFGIAVLIGLAVYWWKRPTPDGEE